MATIALLGTLDTKGHEYAYLAQRLREAGETPLVIDAGILAPPQLAPDIDRAAVARAGGGAADALAAAGDRGAAALVAALHEAGRIDAILGLGGSGGTALVTAAMRALPVGVPKLMVSTVASGDTRAYVGTTDVTMMFSVVDIAGINRFSACILDNAAAAIGGMAQRLRRRPDHRAHGQCEAADRRDDVRRDHRVRHRGAATPGGARLRGAGLPRGRDGRRGVRDPRERRFPRRRPRRDDDRTGR